MLDVSEKNTWIEKQNKSLSLRMLNKQVSTSNKARNLIEKHTKNIRIYKLNAQQCKLLINQANSFKEDQVVRKIEGAVEKIQNISLRLSRNIQILENFYTTRMTILQQYITFFEVVEHFQKNLEFVQTIYADKLPDDRLKAIRAMEKLATARLKTSKNLQNTLDKGRILLKTLRQSRTAIIAMNNAVNQNNSYSPMSLQNNILMNQSLTGKVLKEIDGNLKMSVEEQLVAAINDVTQDDMIIHDSYDKVQVNNNNNVSNHHSNEKAISIISDTENSISIDYITKMLDTLGKYPNQLENVWMEKEIRVDLWCNYWARFCFFFHLSCRMLQSIVSYNQIFAKRLSIKVNPNKDYLNIIFCL